MVLLFVGDDRFNEREVARLNDDEVEEGRYSATTYPGHLVDGRFVYSGSKSSLPMDQVELGHLADDRRTIQRGDRWNSEPIGEVDADGVVYLGTGNQRMRAGRVEPPHAGAAACLLLLFVADRPGQQHGHFSSSPPSSHGD